MAIFKVLNPLVQARGDWKVYIITLLMAAFINIALNVILINIFGMFGAAGASIISYSVAGVSLMIYFIRTFNVRVRDCVFVRKEDFIKLKNFIKK